VKQAVLVANVNGAVMDAGRRLERTAFVFPLELTGGAFQGIKLFIQRADINRVTGDGGRTFDGFLGLEFPEDF
jgi:hypothetical protein